MTTRPPPVEELELKEVAELAGCTASNIRRLLLAGRMPAPIGKKGQTWMFDAAAIHRWLPNRTRRGHRGPPVLG